MKSILKRTAGLLLCFILVFSVCCPIMSYAATVNDYPIVHVIGRWETIYDKDGNKIYPFKSSVPNTIMKDADSLINAGVRGVLWSNWKPLQNELSDALSPAFSQLVLNNNGEVANGSYPKAMAAPKDKKSGYVIGDYNFTYDWRLDPVAIADDLNDYINAVIKVTGHKKVHLVSRCLGTAIASAYLTKYGAGKIDTCVFYAGSAMGIIPAGAFFSGNLSIDPDALARYADNATTSSDFVDLMKTFASLLKRSSLVANITSRNMQEGVDAILPDLLLETYATMPGYWSMVGEDYFEQAKEFVFAGNYQKYAGLIEKIDDYHYNVQQQLPVTLKNLQAQGLKIAVVAKYNYELAPIYKNSTLQSDDTIEVSSMSFGATAANYGSTLSASYIKQAQQDGFDDYISPDLTIDASTCLFPDSTWFFKDVAHSEWPTSIYNFITEMCHTKEQYTVTTNKKYPQFIQYNRYADTLDNVTLQPTVQAVKLSQTSYTYDGKVKSPTVTVVNNAGKVLKSGTDYTVTYDNGRQTPSVGQHSVTVKYKGSYSGSTTLYYEILPPVTKVSVKSTASDSVTLSWTQQTGIDGYKIYQYNSSTKKYDLVATVNSSATLSYKVNKLSPDTSYKFYVCTFKKADNKTYTGAASNTVTARTKPAVPVISVSTSSRSATVKWAKAQGAQGYQVYMATGNGSFKKVAETTSLSKAVTGLTAGNTYYFKVRSYTVQSGKTVYSAFSDISAIVATNSPATPTVTVKTSSKSATVSWGKITGASGYEVYMSTEKNGTYKKIATTSSTSFVKTGLKAGKTYYFRVRAYAKFSGKTYYSAYSSKKSIKATNTPAQVSNLKLTAGTGSIKLAWDKVPGATRYQIYMSTSKNGTYKRVKTTSSLSYTKSGLNSGTRYYFKVRAVSNVSGKTYTGAYSSIKYIKAK